MRSQESGRGRPISLKKPASLVTLSSVVGRAVAYTLGQGVMQMLERWYQREVTA